MKLSLCSAIEAMKYNYASNIKCYRHRSTHAINLLGYNYLHIQREVYASFKQTGVVRYVPHRVSNQKNIRHRAQLVHSLLCPRVIDYRPRT